LTLYELVLRAPEAIVEAVSDALMDELGALSVSVEDADAGSALEDAIFGEPGLPAPRGGWQRSTLRALFESEAEGKTAASRLAAEGSDGLEVASLLPVADTDWVRQTQSQFAPVEITPRFWVVPTWHEPPPGASIAIRLDPGLAFGTGTHPTTRMCLRWIAHRAEATAPRWPRVLDYGCGSGILAIGAGLHGALHIDAVDIDPAAVEATRANAAANGVALSPGAPGNASGTYALVLANILATPLKLLAPLLSGHVAPGGELVLAGILERQAEELTAAYAPWLELGITDAEEGWILMTAQRAGAVGGVPAGASRIAPR